MLTSPWTIKDSAQTDYIENLGQSSPEHFMPEPKGRYLLLGCGNGRGLNKAAKEHPHMQFVGVDWNENYIAEANREKPDNVEYHHLSFEEFSQGDYGTFDAIVLHGVWSFVRDIDRLAICKIIQSSVAPSGLVKVSYDNAVWWNLRRVVRDMAIYYGHRFNGDIDAVLEHLKRLQETRLCLDNQEVREFLEEVLYIEGFVEHWILQPDWRPFYSFEVESIFVAMGFSLVRELDENERDPLSSANSDARQHCEIWQRNGDAMGS